MNEVQGIKSTDKAANDELATATVMHAKDIEDEKERAIAKAALSIAELGALVIEGLNPLELTVGIHSCAGSLLNAPETDDKSSSTNAAIVPLRSIKVVASHEAFIEEARSYITSEMETMVLGGLATLVCRRIAKFYDNHIELWHRIKPYLHPHCKPHTTLAFCLTLSRAFFSICRKL
jgi:hypothetical protein